MSKNNESIREVLCSFTAPMTMMSSADRSHLEQGAKIFFDEVGNCCTSLGIAWPTGLKLKLPNGSCVIFSRPKLKRRSITEFEKEFLRAVVLPMFWDYCMSLPVPGVDHDRIKRKKEQHERAVFGKLRKDKEKRAGADLWMRWRNALRCYRQNPALALAITPMRVEQATSKFWLGFFEAMRTSASFGDRNPTDKWLIEHEEKIKNLTPREVKERFGSQFQATSIRKIHERMNKLGLDHKHEPSGKASPNYRPFRRN
jgi:hypothetical protein